MSSTPPGTPPPQSPNQQSRSLPRTVGPRVVAVPEGDNRERMTCPDCGFIEYANPKVVVGSVIHWQDKILLCRRSINPRRGFWTLPAGYLELNETAQAGALREAQEEACARIALEGLIAVYNIPRLSQVQLIFRARLLDGAFAAGAESLDAKLFAWDEIPWSELAFPSVHWALGHYREIAGAASFAAQTNPAGETGDY